MTSHNAPPLINFPCSHELFRTQRCRVSMQIFFEISISPDAVGVALEIDCLYLLCCMHMQKSQRVEEFMNNFSAWAEFLIQIHQLLADVFEADFRRTTRSFGDVNVILMVGRPWSKSYTRTIADVDHRFENC